MEEILLQIERIAHNLKLAADCGNELALLDARAELAEVYGKLAKMEGAK